MINHVITFDVSTKTEWPWAAALRPLYSCPTIWPLHRRSCCARETSNGTERESEPHRSSTAQTESPGCHQQRLLWALQIENKGRAVEFKCPVESGAVESEVTIRTCKNYGTQPKPTAFPWDRMSSETALMSDTTVILWSYWFPQRSHVGLELWISSESLNTHLTWFHPDWTWAWRRLSLYLVYCCPE